MQGKEKKQTRKSSVVKYNTFEKKTHATMKVLRTIFIYDFSIVRGT